MSEYQNALNRLDDELHGANYELYAYLHDVISQAINDIEAETARADALQAEVDRQFQESVLRHKHIKNLQAQIDELTRPTQYHDIAEFYKDEQTP